MTQNVVEKYFVDYSVEFVIQYMSKFGGV